MGKKYIQIEFTIGSDIESVMKKLKQYSTLVCVEFNTKMLYSDIDDLDSAFKKITGKTKAEFDEAEQKRQAEYEREKREHEEGIPKLITEWIEKGNKILDKKYQEYWAKIVPVRLRDIYKGLWVGACLEVIEQLNKNCDLEEAKIKIEEQGHSGMSFGLVCSMIREFCDRGNEFVEYARA